MRRRTEKERKEEREREEWNDCWRWSMCACVWMWQLTERRLLKTKDQQRADLWNVSRIPCSYQRVVTSNRSPRFIYCNCVCMHGSEPETLCSCSQSQLGLPTLLFSLRRFIRTKAPMRPPPMFLSLSYINGWVFCFRQHWVILWKNFGIYWKE